MMGSSRQMDGKEVELASVDMSHGKEHVTYVDNSGTLRHVSTEHEEEPHSNEGRKDLPLPILGAISVIGAGIQFGWALQLSLLTPYVETLGIPHAWASFIWLCGPISGLLVQPCIGVWSDTCTSRYGRRRPFILGGACLVALAVLLISFSADIGYVIGDKYHMDSETRPFACFIFILGFWCLDLSNNTVQGPSRALLSDLAGSGQMDKANAFYSLWLAVGNILGYSTGAIGVWYKWFPWLTGTACGEACANLKAAFLLAIVFLFFCTSITLYFAKEIPLYKHDDGHLDEVALIAKGEEDELQHEDEQSRTNGTHHTVHFADMDEQKKDQDWPERNSSGAEGPRKDESDDLISLGTGPASILVNLLVGLRSLPPAMRSVLIVMALSWMAWFPFLLFDTDWMGREIFHGDPSAGSNHEEGHKLAALYQAGVREGALGLLLNSIVQAVTSLLIDPLCRKLGPKNVWASGNLIIFACMASTYVVTVSAVKVTMVDGEPVVTHPEWVITAAIVIFAILGAPLAITFSVPYALTAELTADSGGGQGLAMGILNLAIVLPQIVVSLGAGPWDQLFGGGNAPAFCAASFFALCAGVIAFLWLPAARRDGYRPQHSTLAHGGF